MIFSPTVASSFRLCGQNTCATYDTSLDFIRNRIRFWADPLRKHGAQLPFSSEFFRAHFPDVSLTETPAPKILRDF